MKWAIWWMFLEEGGLVFLYELVTQRIFPLSDWLAMGAGVSLSSTYPLSPPKSDNQSVNRLLGQSAVHFKSVRFVSSNVALILKYAIFFGLFFVHLPSSFWLGARIGNTVRHQINHCGRERCSNSCFRPLHHFGLWLATSAISRTMLLSAHALHNLPSIKLRWFVKPVLPWSRGQSPINVNYNNAVHVVDGLAAGVGFVGFRLILIRSELNDNSD